MLMVLVKGYRLLLSPWLGTSCRYEPSCSEYALRALEVHGAFVGTYLTLARLVRCHPWCHGGFDAVPKERPCPFNRVFSSRSTNSKKIPP